MDITCFARINENECAALDGNKCLYPLSFIGVTKNSTNTVNQKVSQASIFANGNFQLMKYEDFCFWVPLLGMIMSEVNIQFRMYYLTLVNRCWKIADIVLIEFPFNLKNMIQSISVLHYWNNEARSFLISQPRHAEVPKSLLFPTTQQNVYIDQDDKVVYKAYDYRTISGKSRISRLERRSSMHYSLSKLKNVNYFIQYRDSLIQGDELIVLRYDCVDLCHVPQKVVQMLLISEEIMELHAKNMVYGNLKLSNCVFNCVDGVYKAALIDFDFVGVECNKCYPATFNTNIDPTDGKRHEIAQPKSPLRKEHHVFAFHYICSLFEVESVYWNQALFDLKNNNCERAMELFKQCRDLDLKPYSTLNIIAGTGSPNRDQKK